MRTFAGGHPRGLNRVVRPFRGTEQTHSVVLLSAWRSLVLRWRWPAVLRQTRPAGSLPSPGPGAWNGLPPPGWIDFLGVTAKPAEAVAGVGRSGLLPGARSMGTEEPQSDLLSAVSGPHVALAGGVASTAPVRVFAEFRTRRFGFGAWSGPPPPGWIDFLGVTALLPGDARWALQKTQSNCGLSELGLTSISTSSYDSHHVD